MPRAASLPGLLQGEYNRGAAAVADANAMTGRFSAADTLSGGSPILPRWGGKPDVGSWSRPLP
jgi:hypothetical protein